MRIEKKDVWLIIGTILAVIGLILLSAAARAAPTYSNVGQNLTYVGMGENIELRAKWTPIDTPYDISTGVYNDYLSVASQTDEAVDIAFNDDGSKLYVLGGVNCRKVFEYTLSTPYDVSTGTYNDYLNVDPQTDDPFGIAFNDDGSKLYLSEITYDRVYEYNLSTPYDVSTGVYNDYLSVGSQTGTPLGIAFNDDGSKLYVAGGSNGKVLEYNLSTPYDVSTGTYNDYLNASGYYPVDIAFNDDGSKLYIDKYHSSIYEFNLSTPYDVSTGVYNDYLSVSSQESYPYGIAFNNNGTKFYVVGSNSDKVHEYNLTGALDTAILYINMTGSYQAVDTIDLNDSTIVKWSNFSYSNSTTCNKVVKWKITANDSTGTSNTTTIGTFYIMPYFVSSTNTSVVDDISSCASKNNATLNIAGAGDANVTVYMGFFKRNATFWECNYKATTGDKVYIKNTSELCNVTAYLTDLETSDTLRIEEDTGISAYPPSNLPTAVAAAGLVIIVIYAITTRKRS